MKRSVAKNHATSLASLYSNAARIIPTLTSRGAATRSDAVRVRARSLLERVRFAKRLLKKINALSNKAFALIILQILRTIIVLKAALALIWRICPKILIFSYKPLIFLSNRYLFINH